MRSNKQVSTELPGRSLNDTNLALIRLSLAEGCAEPSLPTGDDHNEIWAWHDHEEVLSSAVHMVEHIQPYYRGSLNFMLYVSSIRRFPKMYTQIIHFHGIVHYKPY